MSDCQAVPIAPAYAMLEVTTFLLDLTTSVARLILKLIGFRDTGEVLASRK